uniref:K Homology domain-containing protein n=1 Tax=Chromera velia CCMP2878 TaxID=1169474 RepID=A0A0G4HYW1_9ALVE|eukprot:Cvel_9597.t1-p1 / transcript=Cvel_9597.t1 / gene=Cvel_9597 / organism=Chromera_velia_CCMP2878 / gene_product=hypothetical protein / transcript_product=hypothetical protein / location=Cvel_scaffold557:31164-36446(-) / protein_length=880 / sequence_SO=supercontig / SO=protein_coding / is_pseudo=false
MFLLDGVEELNCFLSQLEILGIDYAVGKGRENASLYAIVVASNPPGSTEAMVESQTRIGHQHPTLNVLIPYPADTHVPADDLAFISTQSGATLSLEPQALQFQFELGLLTAQSVAISGSPERRAEAGRLLLDKAPKPPHPEDLRVRSPQTQAPDRQRMWEQGGGENSLNIHQRDAPSPYTPTGPHDPNTFPPPLQQADPFPPPLRVDLPQLQTTGLYRHRHRPTHYPREHPPPNYLSDQMPPEYPEDNHSPADYPMELLPPDYSSGPYGSPCSDCRHHQPEADQLGGRGTIRGDGGYEEMSPASTDFPSPESRDPSWSADSPASNFAPLPRRLPESSYQRAPAPMQRQTGGIPAYYRHGERETERAEVQRGRGGDPTEGYGFEYESADEWLWPPQGFTTRPQLPLPRQEQYGSRQYGIERAPHPARINEREASYVHTAANAVNTPAAAPRGRGRDGVWRSDDLFPMGGGGGVGYDWGAGDSPGEPPVRRGGMDPPNHSAFPPPRQFPYQNERERLTVRDASFQPLSRGGGRESRQSLADPTSLHPSFPSRRLSPPPGYEHRLPRSAFQRDANGTRPHPSDLQQPAYAIHRPSRLRDLPERRLIGNGGASPHSPPEWDSEERPSQGSNPLPPPPPPPPDHEPLSEELLLLEAVPLSLSDGVLVEDLQSTMDETWMRTFLVPADQVPKLVGKDGECTKDLEVRSQTNFAFGRIEDENGRKRVTITGEKTNVEVGTRLLCNKLALFQAIRNRGPQRKWLRVPDATVPQLIGTKGKTVSELQLFSGALVSFDNNSNSNSNGGAGGPQGNGNHVAAAAAAQSNNELGGDIPAGSQAASSSSSRQRQTKTRGVLLAGTDAAVQRAEDLILARVERLLQENELDQES